MAESERIVELERALEEQKRKAQSDHKRLVKRLQEINDSERQKIIEDYESRLVRQAEEHERSIKSQQSEMDSSSERLTVMTNMVEKLKQARIDLLDKIEKKEDDFASKEELLSDEISNLKSELSDFKKSNAQNNESLQEISAGYVLEISQLQDQLAAAQAALKIFHRDDIHSENGSGGDTAKVSDEAKELMRLNNDLQAKLSELETAYEASLQENAQLQVEFQRKSSNETQLQLKLDEAIRNSEHLQSMIQDVNHEKAELKENRSKDLSTINELEQDIQKLLSQSERFDHPTPLTKQNSPAMQRIASLIPPKNAPDADTSLTEQDSDRLSSYVARIQELESQLKQLEVDRPTQSDQRIIETRTTSESDDLALNSVEILSQSQLQLPQQTTQFPDRSFANNLESPISVEQRLCQFLDLVLEQLQSFNELKSSLELNSNSSPTDIAQTKYHSLAQSELRWHEISDHQQNIILSLIQAQSSKVNIIQELQSLRQTNERFKEIVKEQREQHNIQIKNANDKVSLAETSLAEHKKKAAKHLLIALKKLKESPSTSVESQTLKKDLDDALARTESAEKQVVHLQKQLEALELAQDEMLREQNLSNSKIVKLTSTLQSEKNRVETVKSEKQQISSQLVRANNNIAELKEAENILSLQLSRLQTMVSAHWLLDIPAVVTSDSVPDFEVRERCQVDSTWWLFICVKWKSGDSTDSQVFWTTIEAFDYYSGQKIATGLVSDTELVESRNSCLLSSGVSLPDSIESRAEASLKAKFDKKWNNATKRFERKITELNQKLESSQYAIEKITSEFEEYKKQATLALENNPGGAVKVAEMLDKIDQLEQERSLLQSSLRDANQRAVNQTNVEIQRLLGIIESARASFHQSEVKWSHELQALQVENERLINRDQQEESALITSLTERLEISQDELQRHRSSATQIIKERDQTISDLHKQVMSAQENSQELQRQIRVLQAELVSFNHDSSLQAHQAIAPPPLEAIQSHPEPLPISPEHRRSRTNSSDYSVQVQKLQSLLRDAELQREHQSAQMRQLQSQVRELSRSNERSGANLDYLKHIIVKYMETDERLTLLPVIANILAFDPEETERIRAKIEKTNNSGLIPKIW